MRLVEALSDGLGVRDGVVIGRGIASLLVDAYRPRHRPVPAWVKALIAHYAPPKRSA